MPAYDLIESTWQLIDKSLNNTRTKLYDNFQYYTNGIL